MPEATIHSEKYRETADEVAMINDPKLEMERIDPIIPGDTEADMISMQSFVNRCISYDTNGAVLDPNAYNVPERISTVLTSQEDFGTQAIQRLEENVDIDGFLGFGIGDRQPCFAAMSTCAPRLNPVFLVICKLLQDYLETPQKSKFPQSCTNSLFVEPNSELLTCFTPLFPNLRSHQFRQLCS